MSAVYVDNEWEMTNFAMLPFWLYHLGIVTTQQMRRMQGRADRQRMEHQKRIWKMTMNFVTTHKNVEPEQLGD